MKDKRNTFMNFLFFHLRVLTHAKHVMPNTQLCVLTDPSHPIPLASLVIKPCWSMQAEATPQLLPKACCSCEQDQQITTRNGFKSLLLAQDVMKSESTLLPKSQGLL